MSDRKSGFVKTVQIHLILRHSTLRTVDAEKTKSLSVLSMNVIILHAASYTLLIWSVFLLDIQREQEKVKRSIKDAAKKGQKDVCVVLAKEMVQSKRAVSKLHASKAHMNSVILGMRNQLGEWTRPAA